MERVRRLSGAFLHAVGNVFSEPHPLTDVSLNPAQADALIKYQRQLLHPMYLGERAFSITEIVDSETSSIEVQKALIDHDIILGAPATSAPALLAPRYTMEDEIPVKIAAITKNFPQQLTSTGLSISSQKLVVALLCFWSEEWKRWSRLEREERDLTEQIEVARRVDNTRAIGFFSPQLTKVQRKKRLLWSEREENREMVGSSSSNVRSPGSSGTRDREELPVSDAASNNDQLPSYGDSTNSIQIATGGAARVSSGGVDELPRYGDWTSERGVNDNDDGVEQSHENIAIEESQSRGSEEVNKLPS
ncbi:65033eb1-ed3a-4619-89a6-e1fe771522cb [Sclerotinia trifoliorum]|uniref:65033eb1-ed3a-4619-89a6-e1fe771522cb n=1 Tax=Sclerotinia trifoliorum TaxID=28548 RepID=A0A8H2ZQE4_9HELO|nr:65033eb1-ed3a-4619-89a6-e1fe771522cb [Sclerotinia trifoliorum]